MNRTNHSATLRLCLTGVMAALCFVSNYIRIPLLDSQVHIGNALCVLCGFLFGPATGFLAAGIGNLLYDLMAGYGYECLITFVSKGAIALVSGAIASGAVEMTGRDHRRCLLGAILGAATYVALYMLKTFIFGLTVNGLTMEATLLKMAAKLPASAINAVFAAVVTPVFWQALCPALRASGWVEKPHAA